MFKIINILVPFLFIVGCGMKPSIEDAKLSDRNFSLEEFFDGETVAYGQFQDILGNVSRRFLVDIKGSWDGSNLILVEDFKYDDGSEEQRIWTLTKADQNRWVGSADGVVGTAEGKTAGVVCGAIAVYTISDPERLNRLNDHAKKMCKGCKK